MYLSSGTVANIIQDYKAGKDISQSLLEDCLRYANESMNAANDYLKNVDGPKSMKEHCEETIVFWTNVLEGVKQ